MVKKTNKNNTYYNKIEDMRRKLAEHDSKPCLEENCSACYRGSVEE